MKIKKSTERTFSFFMSLLMILSFVVNFNSTVYGDELENSNVDIKTTKNFNGPINEKEIELFSDKFFTQNMKKNNVPGAAIVVVKDGKVIFKKGYGYANIEKKVPIDPDKTVFRNGSVGKLFTAAAVMQLYEKGLINLDDNVNNYLKTFKVNNKFSKPVTFANIMTHSSGLDSGCEIGGASKSKLNQISYENYMKTHVPNVINEPGTITNYSNSGYNLLGYLIEKISGMSYENYMQKNIFDALNMKNSNVVSKVENMASGYNFENGSLNTVNYTGYEPSLGCGSINSTVIDMANFMIANLQNGKLGDNQILNESTSKLMQKQHFTNNTDLPGMAYGFIQNYKNNQKIIKHEGAVNGFITSMFLMPEHNLGFYVATNSLNPITFQFEDAFVNHYYPLKQNKLINPPSNFKEKTHEYAGTYREYHDVSKSYITKCFALFGDDYEVKIEDNKNGTLTMKGMSMEKVPFSTKLVQIKPMLFQRQDNLEYVAFRKDKSGHVTHLFSGNTPEESFEKTKWYENQKLNLCLLAGSLLIFAITSLVCFSKFIIRIIRRKTCQDSKLLILAKLSLKTSCFFNTLCTMGIFAVLIHVGYDMNFGLPNIFYALLSGLMATSILTIFNVVFTFIIWRKKHWALTKRGCYTVITIASVLFICFLNYWNMLGFKL
ncbi:beta-lactamase family protein [Clostridium sp. P21]|uniref:Beta-lactamase family protein n=1 Tax=Clostridium muellerianum TaxID=2716538 RepID=A0A7Y0EHS9_9CLOT|nr:serine hydrolase domain-containing protein [Clostridium muellerianum]NMM63729.1 beta-lactamase family protein [Clostridium muellerianum]